MKHDVDETGLRHLTLAICSRLTSVLAGHTPVQCEAVDIATDDSHGWCVSLTSQYRRVMRRLRDETDPFKKWLYLTALQDRNETLFYHCLCSHVVELAPIVYTPTVALACLNYSSILAYSSLFWSFNKAMFSLNRSILPCIRITYSLYCSTIFK